MPWSSDLLRSTALEQITAIRPETILDVGVGSGVWRDTYSLGVWTGVEIWEPYVDTFFLRERYDKIIVGDACIVDLGGPYDLAIMGDVLEHTNDPVSFLNRVRKVARKVLIQVPIGEYPQDEFEGNPYEAHLVTLELNDLLLWDGVIDSWTSANMALLLILGCEN